MQKLYIYQKPVILARPDENPERENLSFTTLENPNSKELTRSLQALKEEKAEGLFIVLNDSKQFFHEILNHFQHWQAAGGLIANPQGEILLMFRKGKWDLPKGKIDSGESPEETALREVTEETGLKNITIVKKLIETWHSYPISVYEHADPNQKDILKQTHWFQMDFTGKELTIPQIEEDIIDIQWIKPSNIDHYLKYSYPNLKQVFMAAGIMD